LPGNGRSYLPPHTDISLHQLTLLKEHFIDDFALRFQAAGFAALVYDHRGFGSSDGIPRQETNPWQQAEDYQDAVSFASTLAPKIDPKRVCIWGVGHSGEVAMLSASSDPRLRAVILLMPFTSGALDAKKFSKEVMDKAWEERATTQGHSREHAAGIPIWPTSKEHALSTDESKPMLAGMNVWNFIDGSIKRSDAAGTPFVNKLTLQSFIHLSKVEPAAHIHKISPTPLLYLAATTDDVTDPIEVHKKVFEQAKEPKEFVTLDNHHLATYMYHNEAYELSITKQIDFLKRYL
jgi:uncharacterized protein